MSFDRPKLCVVGPLTGRNAGQIPTQGEMLADRLAAENYPVIEVSNRLNRYTRLLDIAVTMIRKRRHIDIQLVQVFSGRAFVVSDIASMLGQRLGQRIVMVLRGGALPEFMARFPAWTHRVLSRADALVAPSNFLARTFTDHGFAVRVIPNVINLNGYLYNHRAQVAPRLFWMRSFHDIYHPEMAVRVLALLRQEFLDASLIMAGRDLGLQPATETLARKLGVEQAVRFAGFLDMSAKISAWQASDIFLNTNRVDNMPVSVIEAWAMGLPVVATAVGGLPDLLTDHETGLLVPDEDASAMAQAIQRLVTDPQLAGQLSANGREMAERFSWAQVYPLWQQLFGDVTQHTRS